jgi:hypothetical protein
MATASHSGCTIKGTSAHSEDEQINPSSMGKSPFEQTLVDVWRQALVENAKLVIVNEERKESRVAS